MMARLNYRRCGRPLRVGQIGVEAISVRWNKRLTGRLGATLKGIAYGGLAGVVTGPLLLVALGPMTDMPSKVGWGLGIFVGLPLGMLLGGIAGAETPRSRG
jgi:hypothetical protein